MVRGYLLKFLQLLQVNMVVFILVMRQMMGAKYMQFLWLLQVNIVVFILVMRQMMGTKYMQNKTQVEKVRTGVKASGVILPLLGITWLFGLLSFNSDTIIFKYIFTIFNSLQGLMIFIFHCILNKQVIQVCLFVCLFFLVCISLCFIYSFSFSVLTFMC